MPRCSIKQCKARKNINHPQLTLHSLPRNPVLHKKWLGIIGTENVVNIEHKRLYVCSMHFDESAFNRTLGVVRLRDNAVPSLLLSGVGNTSLSISCDASTSPEQVGVKTEPHSPEEDPLYIKDQPSNVPKLPKAEDNPPPSTLELRQSTRLNKLKRTCAEQRKKIKRLNETVRRQNKKIADMRTTISVLKNKIITDKESILLVVKR